MHCPSPHSFFNSTLQTVVHPQAVICMTFIVPHLTSPSRLLPFLSCRQQGRHCTVRRRLHLPIPLYKQWYIRKQSLARHTFFITCHLLHDFRRFHHAVNKAVIALSVATFVYQFHSTNSGTSASSHRHDMHCSSLDVSIQDFRHFCQIHQQGRHCTVLCRLCSADSTL